MEIAQPFANHNGGQMVFGPDGYLYVGLGDGGSGGDPQRNGQNLAALLGKILRIDVRDLAAAGNYKIPVDNPFVDTAGAWSEIWAYGLRNPWRFSFDRETGLLWCGDVGQNRWEEIDIITRGANYGWNIMEGFHCYSPATGCDQSGLTLPIVEYDRSKGCSVTGGYVYRGDKSACGAIMYMVIIVPNLGVGLRKRSDSNILLANPMEYYLLRTRPVRNIYIPSSQGGIYTLAQKG
jgi:glucose/arabinose dehydrogenase